MGCGSSTPLSNEPLVRGSSEPVPPAVPSSQQRNQTVSDDIPADAKVTTRSVEIPLVETATTQEPEQTQAKPAPPPQTSKIVGLRGDETDAFGLLLCGAGESGKTTFTRQLRIRFLEGFSNDERKRFIQTIRGNLVESIQLLLVYLERHGMSVDDSVSDIASEIADIEAFNCDFNEDLVEQLSSIWEDPYIQEAFAHRDETAIPDHIDYFFEKINDLVDDNYIPSDEDILRARIRTIGIDAVTLDINGARIRIYDVGGQKNERSKWSRVEAEVESVIFCVSFAEFDKPMFEDPNVIRINDALEIFEGITHNPKFSESAIFLVCNKIDIFEKKIRETDRFITIFPQYTGDPHDPNACADFLIEMFKQKAGGSTEERPIITYKISALDSQQVVSSTSNICEFISNNYFE